MPKNDKTGKCSVAEAAEILGWKYHRTLSHIIKGNISAEKFNWGWMVDKKSVKSFKRKMGRKENI